MKTLWAALSLAACLCAQDANAPNYTSAGIVNGASFASGLAPNTIVSVFGTNLSWNTQTVSPGDMDGSTMPTNLAGVQVYFEGWPAYLYYVSPLQINLLVPASLLPGDFQFWVDRQGTRGPIVTVTLQSAAPALFEYPWGTAIATHLDGSLCDDAAPAAAGEIISLWATGLGNTIPKVQDGVLPTGAQPLAQMSEFSVSIGGTAVNPSDILYAGVAPGFAGLYQVNLQLPNQIAPNPEIRMGLNGTLSPAGLILPAK